MHFTNVSKSTVPTDETDAQPDAGPSGVGVLDISVDSNSGAARTGMIAVQGQTITIQQAAGGCATRFRPTTSPSPPRAVRRAWM